MRFHYPSFCEHLDGLIPLNVRLMFHNYTGYLWADFPLRKDFLRETIIQATLKTYNRPLRTPTPTEARSLIRGLLPIHERILTQTLQQTDPFLNAYKNLQVGTPGERHTEYEYHILIKQLERLCIESIQKADTVLIRQELYHETDASVRSVRKRIQLRQGKDLANDRINRVLNILEEEGFLNRNGGIRTYGRDVIHNYTRESQ